MSDHLPECTYSPGQPGFGGINSGISSTQPYLPPLPCICSALRACEQRVLDAAEAAANEVLDRTPNAMNGEYITVSKHFPADLIAAIDALRQERSGNPDTSPSAENEAIDALREDK